jgi:hypothetical protein
MSLPQGIQKRRDPLTGSEWLHVSDNLRLPDRFTDRETGKTYQKINGYTPSISRSGTNSAYRLVDDGGEQNRREAAERSAWDRHLRSVHNRFR